MFFLKCCLSCLPLHIQEEMSSQLWSCQERAISGLRLRQTTSKNFWRHFPFLAFTHLNPLLLTIILPTIDETNMSVSHSAFSFKNISWFCLKLFRRPNGISSIRENHWTTACFSWVSGVEKKYYLPRPLGDFWNIHFFGFIKCQCKQECLPFAINYC